MRSRSRQEVIDIHLRRADVREPRFAKHFFHFCVKIEALRHHLIRSKKECQLFHQMRQGR